MILFLSLDATCCQLDNPGLLTISETLPKQRGQTQQVLWPTMLGNVSTMLSKRICYVMMIRFPSSPLTPCSNTQKIHTSLSIMIIRKTLKKKTYHFLSLDNSIMILIMKKTLKLKTNRFHSLGNKSTPIGLLSIQMIFSKDIPLF